MQCVDLHSCCIYKDHSISDTLNPNHQNIKQPKMVIVLFYLFTVIIDLQLPDSEVKVQKADEKSFELGVAALTRCLRFLGSLE